MGHMAMMDRVRVVQNYVKELVGYEILNTLFDIVSDLVARLKKEVIKMIDRRIAGFVGVRHLVSKFDT